MLIEILNNPWVVAALSGLGGGLLTILTQRLLGKRGLLTYNVWHDRVGMSAEDAVFGSVKVTWNDNPVANLYVSTIEMRNESLNDYEGVVARVFSSNTFLLTERTDVVGTTHVLAWTTQYASIVTVAPGQQATQVQLDRVYSQRDYLIPTLNRGQVVRFTYLNAAKEMNVPALWVDVLHKGVRIKFREVPQQFWGVPQPAAVLAGSLLGVLVLTATVRYVSTLWIAALVSMIYGFVVLIPGALLVRFWRWTRDVIGG